MSHPRRRIVLSLEAPAARGRGSGFGISAMRTAAQLGASRRGWPRYVVGEPQERPLRGRQERPARRTPSAFPMTRSRDPPAPDRADGRRPGREAGGPLRPPRAAPRRDRSRRPRRFPGSASAALTADEPPVPRYASIDHLDDKPADDRGVPQRRASRGYAVVEGRGLPPRGQEVPCGEGGLGVLGEPRPRSAGCRSTPPLSTRRHSTLSRIAAVEASIRQKLGRVELPRFPRPVRGPRRRLDGWVVLRATGRTGGITPRWTATTL